MIHPFRGTVLSLLIVTTACAVSDDRPARIGFEEARAMFDSRGIQPGDSLPALALVDLDGKPVDLRELHEDRTLVLLTTSLTCNVARRQQAAADGLRERFGAAIVLALVYTIEAHPKTDPCPYTGQEWVPESNVRDEVLIRQPTTLDERLAAARRYRDEFSREALILVDPMSNTGWDLLGRAPNLGLVVDSDGTVRARQGWFDPEATAAVLDAMLAGERERASE